MKLLFKQMNFYFLHKYLFEKVWMLFIIVFLCTTTLSAKDKSFDKFETLLKYNHDNLSRNKVISILGKPEKINQTSKKTVWYYNNDKNSLIIYWKNKTETPEKILFNCIDSVAFSMNINFDLVSGLVQGKTNLIQTITTFGVPKDMTIKERTQEIHYAYKNNVLRLFLRDGLLVDYALY